MFCSPMATLEDQPIYLEWLESSCHIRSNLRGGAPTGYSRYDSCPHCPFSPSINVHTGEIEVDFLSFLQKVVAKCMVVALSQRKGSCFQLHDRYGWFYIFLYVFAGIHGVEIWEEDSFTTCLDRNDFSLHFYFSSFLFPTHPPLRFRSSVEKGEREKQVESVKDVTKLARPCVFVGPTGKKPGKQDGRIN